MKRYLLKYIDIIFLVFITAILLLVTETDYLSKLSKYSLVIIFAAYYFGKFVAGWKNKARETINSGNNK
jgi:hypothetical protein